MNRRLAIGDIHGESQALLGLLHHLSPDSTDWVVLLGDFIDRGPKSAEVLSIVSQLLDQGTVLALRGNHEQMMLDSCSSASAFELWAANGGVQTLRSFGLPPRRDALTAVPSWAWDLLANRLVDFAEDLQHIYVHAGVEPDKPLAQQSEHVLRWLPFSQLEPHQSGKRVICGHTSAERVRALRHAVCLDTGMGKSPDGRLTAMDLNTGVIWQVDRFGRLLD